MSLHHRGVPAKVCYKGDAPNQILHHLPWGKPREYHCVVGGGLSEGQGLEGLQGLARVTPCTNGLSTRGWGGSTVTRPASPAAAGPDPGKSRISSTEVKQEVGWGRLGKQTWQDKRGTTDLLALGLYSIQTHSRAVEGTWVRLAALLGSRHRRCVLIAGPGKVHLKPKVH